MYLRPLMRCECIHRNLSFYLTPMRMHLRPSSSPFYGEGDGGRGMRTASLMHIHSSNHFFNLLPLIKFPQNRSLSMHGCANISQSSFSSWRSLKKSNRERFLWSVKLQLDLSSGSYGSPKGEHSRFLLFTSG
jgi:hypothetical protein